MSNIDAFAASYALKEACEELQGYNLSQPYDGGGIGFLEQCERIGREFTEWADVHVDFTQSDQVWPYLLLDRFGHAVLQFVTPESLEQFDGQMFPGLAKDLGMKFLPDADANSKQQMQELQRRGWVKYPNLGQERRFREDLTLIRELLGSILYEWQWVPYLGFFVRRRG